MIRRRLHLRVRAPMSMVSETRRFDVACVSLAEAEYLIAAYCDQHGLEVATWRDADPSTVTVTDLAPWMREVASIQSQFQI